MTSRERVRVALNHSEPDRVPLDLGASPVTGMHVNSVYALRQALELDPPNTPVKVIEPYQMLGEIAPDLMDALDVDVVGISPRTTLFGFANTDWKLWTTMQGAPVLVPSGFSTDLESNGDLLLYPEGDKRAPASGRMPAGGWYFDTIIRQPPINDEQLRPEDNLEEFAPLTSEDLAHVAAEVDRLRTQTDKAILLNIGGTAFGDIALVPAPWLKYPKGIRDVEEWYVSVLTRRDYIYEVFERQCAIALKNIEVVASIVGDRIDVAFLTGTDFGTQKAPFISTETYCDLYKPFHKALNDWIHENTSWKTFIHSCGSIRPLIPHFIDAGFDILNPVQCSAANMDACELKQEYGDRVTFWGGGVDTQNTLPFGLPDDVYAEVRSRIKIFGRRGGFVFNTIHNVQAQTPVENVIALYRAVRECGSYPL